MARGGIRKGAGRPKGSGKYGEKTIPLRVPESLADAVNEFIENNGYEVPLFSSKVAAGTPDIANDHIDEKINVAAHIIKNPEDTFCVRVQGESMIKVGINPDDILVVDRKVEPRHGKIVVAAVNGELTVKRLHLHGDRVTLMPENDAYAPIPIRENTSFHIWGTVRSIIKNLL